MKKRINIIDVCIYCVTIEQQQQSAVRHWFDYTKLNDENETINQRALYEVAVIPQKPSQYLWESQESNQIESNGQRYDFLEVGSSKRGMMWCNITIYIYLRWMDGKGIDLDATAIQSITQFFFPAPLYSSVPLQESQSVAIGTQFSKGLWRCFDWILYYTCSGQYKYI
jgi:hypothetical protein